MRYLSQEWIAAADQAVKDAAGSAPKLGLTVDQHVAGALNYRVTIGASPAIAVISDTDSSGADAVFAQDMSTAVAVAQGTTDAHQAFLLGHIRFTGSIDVLIERRDAFDWLQAALAPVLAATTF